MKHKLLAFTIVGLLVSTSAAVAHHSIAQYEEEDTITITGTVSRFLWTNPHVWIFMDVVDEQTGEQVQWRVESSSPMGLARRDDNWKMNVLEPGQEVTVILHPMKDGTPMGHFVEVTTNGMVLDAGR